MQSMRQRQTSSVAVGAADKNEDDVDDVETATATAAVSPSSGGGAPPLSEHSSSRRRRSRPRRTRHGKLLAKKFKHVVAKHNKAATAAAALAGIAIVLLLLIMARMTGLTRSTTDGSGSSGGTYAVSPIIRTPHFVPQVSFANKDSTTRCPSSTTTTSSSPLLTRSKLDQSLALGTSFLLQHQKVGVWNFDYQYDWQTDELDSDDAEVRQAGALWGLSLILHDAMEHYCNQSHDNGDNDNDIQVKGLTTLVNRIQKGLAFYETNSRLLYNNHAKNSDSDNEESTPPRTTMRYLTYPNAGDRHDTGTQALVCLALVDLLRAIGPIRDNDDNDDASLLSTLGLTRQAVQHYQQLLDELLPFLVTQHSQVMVASGRKGGGATSRFEAFQSLIDTAVQVQQDGGRLWNDGAKGKGGGDSTSVAMRKWWKDNVELYAKDSYFYDKFNAHGDRKGKSSPYYDGESILCLVKAAKYLGSRYVYLWPLVTGTAIALHQEHVVNALEEDEDSDETKGVYQWLSMSLFELATVTFGPSLTAGSGRSSWMSLNSWLSSSSSNPSFDLPSAIEPIYPQEQFGTWLVELALWMVQVHHTLRKPRNTGYAYEGIVPAWTWATHVVTKAASTSEQQHPLNGELVEQARSLHCTIEKGLSKLISWQVGMGAEDQYEDEEKQKWDGVRGLGGVQNAADEPGLRIDVAQHQMHATILTRRYVYPPGSTVGDVDENAEPSSSSSWPWAQVLLPAQQVE